MHMPEVVPSLHMHVVAAALHMFSQSKHQEVTLLLVIIYVQSAARVQAYFSGYSR